MVSDISEVISFFESGSNKNYGKYKPKKKLQNLFNEAKKECVNPSVCLSLKQNIFLELASDYANIFLWSPNIIYAYHKKYFRRIPGSWRNSTHVFFDLPHKKWKLND